MENKKTIIIVDGNNLLYRVYFKFAALTNEKGKPTSILYGYPYVLSSIIRRYNPFQVYNVFDGGKDPHRLKKLPEYKQRDKRIDMDIDNFYKQRDMLKNLLPRLKTRVVMKDKREADDLIYSLVKRLKYKFHIVIVSSDKDFNQLLEKNVVIFNPSAGIELNPKNLKRHVGYEPKECVDYLILDGDSSDKIPGYKGFGPAKIRKFLDSFTSIKSYLEKELTVNYVDNEILKQVYKRNRYLIDLKFFNEKHYPDEIINYKPCLFLKARLYRYCQRHGISQFLKPEFYKLFQNLEK